MKNVDCSFLYEGLSDRDRAELQILEKEELEFWQGQQIDRDSFAAAVVMEREILMAETSVIIASLTKLRDQLRARQLCARYDPEDGSFAFFKRELGD